MGPWEVSGNVAAILVVVLLVVAAAGVVTLTRARRRRHDAEEVPDEGLLREEALERLRQVQAQWEKRAGGSVAGPTGAEQPPTPTGRRADRPLPGPPETPDRRPGPAHVGRRTRRGRGASVVLAVAGVVVLGIIVGATLVWLTRA